MEQVIKTMGFLLFLVSRAHHNLATRTFSKLGLFRGQPPVLFELGRNDNLTQTELAEKMEVTPATMTNLLRRLELSGLVNRERDVLDGRISRVSLTQRGVDVVARARELAEGMDRVLFAGFSPHELDTMRDFLQRMHANLTAEAENSTQS